MEEQNKTMVESPEQTMIEQAKAVAQRIEAANKVTADLLERQEKAQVRQIMGGHSQAGQAPVEKTEEEKKRESARAMLKGTGYDDILFPVENIKTGEK